MGTDHIVLLVETTFSKRQHVNTEKETCAQLKHGKC